MSTAVQTPLADAGVNMPSPFDTEGFRPVDETVSNGSSSRHGTHGCAPGEVFTQRWVADLVLDLAGYCADRDLGASLIVEPACGSGAFLVSIVERLVRSCALHGRPLAEMRGAVQALDVNQGCVERSRAAVASRLQELGATVNTSHQLSRSWIGLGDFLLTTDWERSADFVVGNPPYVRLEDIPPRLSEAYRAACPTMRGRADLFVGFYERGLSRLAPDGKLAFICADRWMRNQYGARLRSLIVREHAVDAVVVMHDVDAFENRVSAYPAITVLRSGTQGPTKVVEANSDFGSEDGRSVAGWVAADSDAAAPRGNSFEAASLRRWFRHGEHWPLGSPRKLELISELEARFPPLEDRPAGTRIGIGIATGCDEVFTVSKAPGVETSRLMPLIMAQDTADGTASGGSQMLVNPWKNGHLVDLEDYPGLAAYLTRHRDRLSRRHVAVKRPATWYRTIDRVTPGLLRRPKLLLPDLKARAHPVLDTGDYYPHHNLYYVVSNAWDLEVLGGILLSDIANLFVGAYSVRMRGGTFRFQAQYLRKIRVPSPNSIEAGIAHALAAAFRERDVAAATDAAASLYGIGHSRLRQLAA